ncbi:MAG: type II toxin-antitoxin system HicB family antitoxin [Candidatus Binatus sp.]|jgi:predicted RNase H-like HicB family nuclease|uniref:type II toxin-antitoxin system HicB family antitoxin n=1 Tax=Candidatus Binatus sp. TaxID=2811406 RepID=UPI003C75914F
MKIKVIVHKAEEGGFWAEVPAIPGCATQGETEKELFRNIYEAIVGCLSADDSSPNAVSRDQEVEEVEILEAA